MRRTALVVSLFLLLVAAGTVSPAVAQPTASAPSDVAADFNHDGFADLAIGVPGEGFGGPETEIAGAVNVLYGAGSGLSGSGGQLFSQVGGRVEFRDRYGSALAAGDFNGDGFADLAGGASGEDVGSIPDAGAVSVQYGSAAGLTTSGGRLFTHVGSTAQGGLANAGPAGLTVTELVVATGRQKTWVYDRLGDLQQAGLAERASQGRYALAQDRKQDGESVP